MSGLNIGDEGHYDLKLELLKQYLLGELGNAEDKLDGSLISQLIIAGDSIMPIQNLRAEMDLKILSLQIIMDQRIFPSIMLRVLRNLTNS